MTEPTEPPRGDEMRELLSTAKAHVLSTVATSRSSRRRRRLRLLGGLAAGAIALGGVTTATATGLFGGVEATDTKTADFDLGPAPVGATYVEVTVDAVCQPSARYEIDLDHAKNPASMTCGKKDDGRPSQLSYELELRDKRPTHTVTVTTNVERKYSFRAHYRTGLTENQRFSLKMKALEAQREENARRVQRTDKVPSSDPYNHPAAWPDPYYVNENGMTIGTFDQMTTPYEQWPDLTPIEGPGGLKAFTYSGKRGFAVNPDEAVAYMKWQVDTGQMDPMKNGRWSKTYLVYLAEDGKTVLAKQRAGSVRSD